MLDVKVPGDAAAHWRQLKGRIKYLLLYRAHAHGSQKAEALYTFNIRYMYVEDHEGIQTHTEDTG